MKSFPFYKQSIKMDCGPTCLRMIAKFYGKRIRQDSILAMFKISQHGVSLLGIKETANKLGFNAIALEAKPKFLYEINLPAIVHWNQNHFVVLFDIKNHTYYIADPEKGILKYTESVFLNHWLKNDSGIVLTFSPIGIL